MQAQQIVGARMQPTIRTACQRAAAPETPQSKREKKGNTKMKDNNKRDLYLKIRVSREELDAIDRKFQNSSMKSRSDFVRAMIFEGYIVQIDESKLREIIKLARTVTNNVNQIAVRVNSTNHIYADDIAEIKEGVNQLWQPLRFFQSQLMKLHH